MERPSVTGRAAVLCAAAALASVVLAACGSVPASPTAAASGTSPTASAPAASPTASPSPSPTVGAGAAETEAVLCHDTAAVTGLEIVRDLVAGAAQLQGTFPSPGVAMTSARARSVARALCALPQTKRGVFSCPLGLPGTTYLLRFTADGRQLSPVVVQATGCEAVSGVGSPRWAISSPGFWRTLAEAAGLSPPGRAAFSGSAT
jgi:hypothetical protein